MPNVLFVCPNVCVCNIYMLKLSLLPWYQHIRLGSPGKGLPRAPGPGLALGGPGQPANRTAIQNQLVYPCCPSAYHDRIPSHLHVVWKQPASDSPKQMCQMDAWTSQIALVLSFITCKRSSLSELSSACNSSFLCSSFQSLLHAGW